MAMAISGLSTVQRKEPNTTELIQDIANHLTLYDRQDLEEVNLTGARTYSKKTVKRLKAIKHEQTGRKVQNLLKKKSLLQSDQVLRMLENWAVGEPCYVWMSDTLLLDFNLPFQNIPECPTLQAVVLCEQRPAIVLTLNDADKGSQEDAKRTGWELSLEIAQQLSSALLDFCCCEFVLIPCSLGRDNLSKKGLQKEIQEQTRHITEFYSIPDRLSPSTFTALSAAMSAVASATDVPCFFERSDLREKWLLLLEGDWHNLLSLLIELLRTKGSKGDCDRQVLTYTEESEFKMKVAMVEAAKRLSISETVLLVTTDEKLRSSIREMMEHLRLGEEVELKLQVISPEETLPSARRVIYIDCPDSSFPFCPSHILTAEASVVMFKRQESWRDIGDHCSTPFEELWEQRESRFAGMLKRQDLISEPTIQLLPQGFFATSSRRPFQALESTMAINELVERNEPRLSDHIRLWEREENVKQGGEVIQGEFWGPGSQATISGIVLDSGSPFQAQELAMRRNEPDSSGNIREGKKKKKHGTRGRGHLYPRYRSTVQRVKPESALNTERALSVKRPDDVFSRTSTMSGKKTRLEEEKNAGKEGEDICSFDTESTGPVFR